MGGTARDDGLQPISGPVLRAARETHVAGLSRRQLMRRAVGAGVGLWFLEVTAGTLGFLWSAAAQATAKVRIGTFDELLLANGDLPIADGFPAYVAPARAFVTIVDPNRRGWSPGRDETGEGTALNVRAMSQRCPHLGCRPNPCIEDFWFQCPCHQSRYDRLGIKAAGELFGPGTARARSVCDRGGRRRAYCSSIRGGSRSDRCPWRSGSRA